MEFSIATLLSNFPDEKLVAAKALEKKLGCQEENGLRQLEIALDALEKIGILVKERGKYRRVFEPGVVEAKLRCSSKGFCFAIQNVEGAADIYVRESHLSTAWNGDRVLVKITKEGNRRRSPEGEVRLVLERANPSVLARVKQSADRAGRLVYRAVPLDDRLLFELDLLANGKNLGQSIDHLVHVEILRYPLATQPPVGRVAQILGSDAEAAADIDIVCCKHDLPRRFPNAVLAQAEKLPTSISKTDLKNRLDLRHLVTIAITPDSYKESESGTLLVEQAFTLEKIDAENWRVGVHIADVASYVETDSTIDREAQRRGRCVHLGEMVLPLLPEAVLQRCSLLMGEDKLAISVQLTLNSSGQLVEFEILPSVIQVDYQLTQSQARAIMKRHETAIGRAVMHDLAPVIPTLDQLLVLSQMVKEHRQQRGGFALEKPETTEQFSSQFSDEGANNVLVTLPSRPDRSLLAEWMILVNQVVASHINALGVPGMYRIQSAPDPDDAQELIKLASNLGIDLQLEQEDIVLPSDFQRFIQQFAASKSQKVLDSLLQGTLKPAFYSTTPGSHFSLALDTAYTHCISPAQRYSDLLVQRILQAVFEHGRDRRTTRAKEQVNLGHSSCHGNINWNVLPPSIHQELEAHLTAVIVPLNERQKEAEDAEADLAGLKKAELMKERTGEVFPGVITGVQSYGFFVEMQVPLQDGKYFYPEGLVHVSSLKDDWYEYRSRQEALVGRKNRKQYRLGDRVEVQVKSVDYYRQQIDLVTVGSNHQISDEDLDEDPFINIDDE
ncbi:ribonuclease R family protein [Argonema galeatum]|uniref:ribonuclease R family protein n=1 Tax=Argonema galeatum TaxID=2942762 RepID=UPI002013B2C1|nr:ribonuclease R family protein [Argonema galeatum]MCL1468369.1 ribonuclease R [Argonema galeatum A003/A1]